MGRALILLLGVAVAALVWLVGRDALLGDADAVARVGAWVARADPGDPAGFARFTASVFAASLVSEDLTCIGVGLLVAGGRVALGPGVAACAIALWLGDLVLYAAGRCFDLSRWRRGALRGTGPVWILGSRFVPGARLPTYVGAGALRYPLGSFAFWLAIGAALWAPVLVGGAAGLGGMLWTRQGGLALAALALALYGALQLGMRVANWRSRRLLLGAWLRWRHWEFWPSWLLYAPLVPWLAWLALRHRSIRVVTAANPAMPGGGLFGESKAPILAALAAAAPDLVARTAALPSGAPAERLAAVHAFLREHGLAFPVVLKPDVAERGAGVVIVRDAAALHAALAASVGDLLVQEYVPGVEAGLFYVRRPGEPRGRLVSITEKRMIGVTGDGRATLESLILRDSRAVCLAPVHLARHAAWLERVPAAGERVPLVEIGTHSRGALFLDGAALTSPALEAAVERLSRGYAGFHLGRYDVRADSLEALRAGRFRAVELNGLTAEPTHMYDPRHGVGVAWRALAAQWRIAFEIGAANAAAGARPASWRDLARLWRAHRRAGRARVARAEGEGDEPVRRAGSVRSRAA